MRADFKLGELRACILTASILLPTSFYLLVTPGLGDLAFFTSVFSSYPALLAGCIAGFVGLLSFDVSIAKRIYQRSVTFSILIIPFTIAFYVISFLVFVG